MKLALAAISLALAAGCGSNVGSQSIAAVTKPNVTGTVFTIIFENENALQVLMPSNPNFYTLSQANGRAASYVSSTHPSLPNYIFLMSGSTDGVTTDNDPADNIRIPGTADLPDQLEVAGVPWRAYMESMGKPCNFDSTDLYSAHHNPFLYYDSIAGDPARCAERVVDFDQSFQADLDSGAYKYMWITPNMCDDMHNCPGPVADAWLGKTIAQITASKAYQNGGAIFVLFDEGSQRYLGTSAELPTIVMSPNLVAPHFVSQTMFDHGSYVATIEDIFDLPRLPTTVGSTPMSEFFSPRPSSPLQ